MSPLANTVVKVTPRVTIAQTSYTETSDESGESFKDGNDAKGEKKMAVEQKPEYPKITHGISINLGNVGMSNSCGSTQLPRIAEEKDSPTGSKADDYAKEVPPCDRSETACLNKSIGPEGTVERRHRVESKTEGQNSCAKNPGASSVNKIEESVRLDNFSRVQPRSLQSASHKQSQGTEKLPQPLPQKLLSQSNEKSSQPSSHKATSLSSEKIWQPFGQKIASQINERGSPQVVAQKLFQGNERGSQAASQKQLQSNEKATTSHKSAEQKAAGKKYKVDSSEGSGSVSSTTQHSCTFEPIGSVKDKKSN